MTKLSLLACVFLIAGCGDDASTVCVRGSTQLCVGAGGCTGGQACLEDGTGWDTCLCEGPPGSDAGMQDAGPDASTIDSGLADAGMSVDAGTDAGSPPLDQCLSSTDMAILLAPATDGGATNGMEQAKLDGHTCYEGDCFDVVLEGGDVDTCMNACLAPYAIGSASVGCRGCFIDFERCEHLDCLLPCLGTDQELCSACLVANCMPDATVCIGY